MGGFDFFYSNYNRAIQAKRQPGSNFKPFIYAAALENGFTAASIINDAPIVKFDSVLEKAWRPENSGGKFSGPIRLREGLYRSKNYVAIRVLDAMGFTQAIRHMDRFGFDKASMPRDLTLALGSHVLTPMEVARGYTVFANGGYKIEPYFITRIANSDDKTLFQARPVTVCRDCNEPPAASEPDEPEASVAATEIALEQELEQLLLSGQLPAQLPEPVQLPEAPQVMDPRVAYIMDSILKDVIRRGTGTRARALGRDDIAGKTGTVGTDINNFDAWFSGYNPELVTTAWIGFDQNLPLGRGEYGATAALPIWMDYMKVALRGKPEVYREQPPGLVSVRINEESGLRARPGDPNFIFEIFREEHVPPLEKTGNYNGDSSSEEVHPDEVF